MSFEQKRDSNRKNKLVKCGNVNRESSWSDDLSDEPQIYRQTENVIPKEAQNSQKIQKNPKETARMSSTKKPTAVKNRKEIVRMSSLKKTSTFKKYKRIVKNVITKKLTAVKNIKETVKTQEDRECHP